MDWRILGPVEGRYGGHTLPIRRPQERAVLAYLLLNANRLVSSEQLIDAVWGGSPPSAARGQLQVCLSHIRTAIREVGVGGALTSQDGGYRLTADDTELDLARFVGALANGRVVLDHDPNEAVDLLRTGLALWRGAALAGSAGAFVESAAAGLHEQRLAAFEELAEAELALGRYAQVAAELRPLVNAHPFRERLVGQLMAALAGSGQQAPALELYAATRSALADELGVEPGPGLAAVHLRILRQRRRIALPSEPPAAVISQPSPRQLPLDVPGFTGRAAEVTSLSRLLEPGGVAVVYGPGGSGKSALAVHIAHHLARQFVDGQLYVNLRGATPGVEALSPADVLAQFLRSLGWNPHTEASTVDELAAGFRSATAGKRMLIVLDDAVGFSQVKDLIPGSSACAVLITARQPLTGIDGIHHHRLRELTEEDAVRLLARLGGARISEDRNAAEELARLCDRFPLALSIAAARLNTRPTWTATKLAARLRDQHRRLDELAYGDRAVRASFTVSYEDLLHQRSRTDAARMFRLIGLLDAADFGAAAVAALADVPEDRAEELLDVLIDAQLLENDVPGRYRLHDLLRLLANERAFAEEAGSSRAAALQNVFHHYLATARNASRAIRPIHPILRVEPLLPEHQGSAFRTHTEAVEWVESERDNLPMLVQQAATTTAIGPSIAVALTSALLVPLGYAGLGRHQVALSEVACAVAPKTNDPRHLAAAAFIRGGVLHNTHPTKAAGQLRQAKELWRQLGDRAGEALASVHLGTTYGLLHRAEDSLACLEEALALNKEISNAEGEASCLDHLGIAYRRLGRREAAIAAHEASIQITQQLGLQAGEAISTANLATTVHTFGDLSPAISHYEEALQLARKARNRQVEAECLWGIAQASNDLGRTAYGKERRRESARILYDLGWISSSEKHIISTQPNPPVPPGFWTNI